MGHKSRRQSPRHARLRLFVIPSLQRNTPPEPLLGRSFPLEDFRRHCRDLPVTRERRAGHTGQQQGVPGTRTATGQLLFPPVVSVAVGWMDRWGERMSC
ncbi:hypothetical protein LZ32DRAFT_605110 [Colletotrichum eremochloae]|nr:hypothetical protein LZ32DRAFT_605110 [Colletotrichum eremochloae]